MSYEAAILSVGEDDSVPVKSFIIAADEVAVQWYSLLSPSVIHEWDDLKQRILSNFQGFQRPELTESDLFLVSRRTRNLSKTTLGDSFTSGPSTKCVGRCRHQRRNCGLESCLVSFASHARKA
jgi:hypothetical protein